MKRAGISKSLAFLAAFSTMALPAYAEPKASSLYGNLFEEDNDLDGAYFANGHTRKIVFLTARSSQGDKEVIVRDIVTDDLTSCTYDRNTGNIIGIRNDLSGKPALTLTDNMAGFVTKQDRALGDYKNSEITEQKINDEYIKSKYALLDCQAVKKIEKERDARSYTGLFYHPVEGLNR